MGQLPWIEGQLPQGVHPTTNHVYYRVNTPTPQISPKGHSPISAVNLLTPFQISIFSIYSRVKSTLRVTANGWVVGRGRPRVDCQIG